MKEVLALIGIIAVVLLIGIAFGLAIHELTQGDK